MTELDTSALDRILEAAGRGPEAALPVLQAIQAQWRHVPDEALRYVSAHSDIAAAQLEGVASFFPQFRRTPLGEHVIRVCDGTACHVKGAPAVFDALAQKLRLAPGADTDADGRFTLQKVSCLGCCTLAPAVQIDETTYGHVRPDGVGDMLEEFLRGGAGASPHEAAAAAAPDASGEIRIGLGSCCVAGGSGKVFGALTDALDTLGAQVRVKRTSCVGVCHLTPLLEFHLPGVPPKLYAKVQPEDVHALVLREVGAVKPLAKARAMAGAWLERLYAPGGTGADGASARVDVDAGPTAAFLERQRRIATQYCGEIDPTDLDEYERLGGFAALRQCLGAAEGAHPMAPADIIARIADSGLRGRGGAGYPTAVKWQAVREAAGAHKYVICNGDEGDPGAFMDRMILESYPFRVIEGMTIAALAIHAQEGVCYIRGEYPLAVRRVEEAIAICEGAGLLGDNILGTGRRFGVRVRRGAGAFVCGEETGLIASLEGRRGSPRYRPPYPAAHGLHGRPTLVNNTETLALVPWIIREGAADFAALGTERSKGTKVFSLAGKVARGGLIEVPMGMTLREIVEDIGGGVAGGRTFKAVQVGGPSGGCIPASLGGVPVDYEALAEMGGMMGSGGFVVLDDTDCMVEMARYFLSFTQRESCGKCTPCRVGTKRMLEILERLCEGEGRAEDLDRLEQLARVVQRQSLCGLGKTAPNPVLTTLEHFRGEYEAHVEGRCPAGVCKALITYRITDACIGCTKCAQGCPVGAIAPAPYEQHVIDASVCVRCGACRAVCPADAVVVE